MKSYKTSVFLFAMVMIFSMVLLSGCGGAPDIEKLKEEGDIKGLIAALGYDNDEESSEVSIARREAAIQALEDIGAPAVEPLIGALSDKNVNIR